MEKAFSKVKDVDLSILMELNDRDLLSVCLTNKYVHNNVKMKISGENG